MWRSLIYYSAPFQRPLYICYVIDLLFSLPSSEQEWFIQEHAVRSWKSFCAFVSTAYLVSNCVNYLWVLTNAYPVLFKNEQMKSNTEEGWHQWVMLLPHMCSRGINYWGRVRGGCKDTDSRKGEFATVCVKQLPITVMSHPHRQ